MFGDKTLQVQQLYGRWHRRTRTRIEHSGMMGPASVALYGEQFGCEKASMYEMLRMVRCFNHVRP